MSTSTLSIPTPAEFKTIQSEHQDDLNVFIVSECTKYLQNGKHIFTITIPSELKGNIWNGMAHLVDVLHSKNWDMENSTVTCTEDSISVELIDEEAGTYDEESDEEDSSFDDDDEDEDEDEYESD